MRVLRQFILSVLIILSVLVGGTILVRVVAVRRGAAQLSQAVMELKSSHYGSRIAQYCRSLGTIDDNLTVARQVRFISHDTYVQEAICPGFTARPLVIQEYTLPRFVSKVPGSSGFILGESLSGVTLTTFEPQLAFISSWAPPWLHKIAHLLLSERRPVVFDGSGIALDSIVAEVLTGPPSSCGGFGYTCCDSQSQLGQGQLISSAVDCPRSCYESCQDIPVVLSLTTSPPYSLETMSMNVSSNEVITFNYVLDIPAGSEFRGKIEYGDGQSEALLSSAGQLAHAYDCNSLTECRYTARLLVTSTDNEPQNVHELQSLSIVVR